MTRIEAIIVDGYFTIFTLEGGKSYPEIMQDIIRRRSGVRVPTEQIKAKIKVQRARLEDRRLSSYAEKWWAVNRGMLADLAIPDSDNSIAAEIQQSLAGDSRLYEVRQDIREFLTEAKRSGIKVIVASNSDEQPLRTLIQRLALGPLIHRAYSSSRVGCEKPHKEFFRRILAAEGLEPSSCIMVGDDPRHDMEGCHAAGLMGVLYDPKEEHLDFEGLRIASFKDLWALDLWGLPAP